ncbi:hypothetical protein KW538_08070 [Vibrio fluvialis]|nr:hypothetical protein [Vibrio fluvialis]
MRKMAINKFGTHIGFTNVIASSFFFGFAFGSAVNEFTGVVPIILCLFFSLVAWIFYYFKNKKLKVVLDSDLRFRNGLISFYFISAFVSFFISALSVDYSLLSLLFIIPYGGIMVKKMIVSYERLTGELAE